MIPLLPNKIPFIYKCKDFELVEFGELIKKEGDKLYLTASNGTMFYFNTVTGYCYNDINDHGAKRTLKLC